MKSGYSAPVFDTAIVRRPSPQAPPPAPSRHLSAIQDGLQHYPESPRRALFLCMNAAGSALSNLAIAASAMRFRLSTPDCPGAGRRVGTISSKTTGTPALATWAAMLAPTSCANHRNFFDAACLGVH